MEQKSQFQKHSLLSLLSLIMITLPLSISGVKAAEMTEKTIYLIAKDGSRFPAGTISFQPKDGGETYKINWNDQKFGDFFLAMRPFKCIEGKIMYCQLPYPFKTRKLITSTDLMDLEYDLLFIQKLKKNYGINFWNGVYFRLKRGEDGTITGKVWETDMNELAIPPDDEYGRPIGGEDLVEAGAGKHRFPAIEIK